MKLRKLIHHILISIGVLFGITITGSAINAKANQTTYTNYNNPATNQDAYSNRQTYQPSANLVNQSGQEYNNYQNNQNNNYPDNQDSQGIQNQYNLNIQTVNRKSSKIYNNILKSPIHRHHHHKGNKNPDKLSKPELEARDWVSWHESNHQWNVRNNQTNCIGYFQLNSQYLGTHDGHVNLNKEHQIHVADSYVQNRYGSWVNAKKFWEIHSWY